MAQSHQLASSWHLTPPLLPRAASSFKLMDDVAMDDATPATATAAATATAGGVDTKGQALQASLAKLDAENDPGGKLRRRLQSEWLEQDKKWGKETRDFMNEFEHGCVLCEEIARDGSGNMGLGFQVKLRITCRCAKKARPSVLPRPLPPSSPQTPSPRRKI